jgi:8-amino-7-oxononanoate synthase
VVLDFTSSLYLGLRHETASLRPWEQLTTGVPGALREPDGTTDVARRLAALQGCEQATLAPSTLHLFVDLCAFLASARTALHLDGGAYEVARLGSDIAAARGTPVSTFPRHDVAALRDAVGRHAIGPHAIGSGRVPVVVADAFTPGVGPAPVHEYLALVRRAGGLLVLDDTQALGVLGPHGGGSLRLRGIAAPEVVLVCSLAKAFGAPVAALSGAALLVRRLRRESATRVHCSPPSAAAVNAAARALAINASEGDRLRLLLSSLVRRFRDQLAAVGLRARGGQFPVQDLGPPEVPDPVCAHARLLELGISTVLRRVDPTGPPRLTFLFTAAHRHEDVDRAVGALVDAVGGARRAAGAVR